MQLLAAPWARWPRRPRSTRHPRLRQAGRSQAVRGEPNRLGRSRAWLRGRRRERRWIAGLVGKAGAPPRISVIAASISAAGPPPSMGAAAIASVGAAVGAIADAGPPPRAEAAARAKVPRVLMVAMLAGLAVLPGFTVLAGLAMLPGLAVSLMRFAVFTGLAVCRCGATCGCDVCGGPCCWAAEGVPYSSVGSVVAVTTGAMAAAAFLPCAAALPCAPDLP